MREHINDQSWGFVQSKHSVSYKLYTYRVISILAIYESEPVR